MKKTHLAELLIIATFAIVSLDTAVSADSDSLKDEITTCAHIKISDARFACYEVLGKRVLDDAPGIGAEQTVAVREPAAATTPDGLPDDLGGGEFAKSTAAESERSQGHIQSCEKGIDGRWYFQFENGQVWKQSNSDKRKFRNCDIDATISKDKFGYILEIDGDTRKSRVQRRR